MKKGLVVLLVVCAAAFAFQNCGRFATAPLSSNAVQELQPATPVPIVTPTQYPGNLTRGFNANLSGPNIIPVTVGGCGFAVPNSACVSVTICVPGSTSQCQTIPNIQLTTTDSGLRIFSSVVTLNLPAVTNAGVPLANCDETTAVPLWGQLQKADIYLGGEPVVNSSIQSIDSNFPGAPSGCQNSASSPSVWGANGTLGIGPGYYDCGPYCMTEANNGIYYTCSGGTCSPSTVNVHDQVTNPVALLPVDNNGIAVTLPALVAHASSSPVSGSLILGIGTRANNTPESATAMTTDDYGLIRAQIGGQTHNAFFEILDNTNYFSDAASLPSCQESAAWNAFYCPTSEQILSVTFSDPTGAMSAPATVSVGNAYTEANSNSGNVVWDDVAQTDSDNNVVMGAGFFFGKTVYVGIVGVQSPMGMGPYYGF